MLNKVEFQNVRFSPNTTGMLKLRRLRIAEHIACIGEKRNSYKVWSETLKETDHD
jgi:hypothetical protein